MNISIVLIAFIVSCKYNYFTSKIEDNKQRFFISDPSDQAGYFPTKLP